MTGDETGWHVNGDPGCLWIMTTELVTVYGIMEGRGYEEAASLLGADFGGVLVRDGWAIYPRFVEAEHQTCLAPLPRRCREMREVTWGRGREAPLCSVVLARPLAAPAWTASAGRASDRARADAAPGRPGLRT